MSRLDSTAGLERVTQNATGTLWRVQATAAAAGVAAPTVVPAWARILPAGVRRGRPGRRGRGGGVGGPRGRHRGARRRRGPAARARGARRPALARLARRPVAAVGRRRVAADVRPRRRRRRARRPVRRPGPRLVARRCRASSRWSRSCWPCRCAGVGGCAHERAARRARAGPTRSQVWLGRTARAVSGLAVLGLTVVVVVAGARFPATGHGRRRRRPWSPCRRPRRRSSAPAR